MFLSPDSDLTIYEDRLVFSARGASSEMWVDLAWEGQHPDHPFRLPDGREYDDVIMAGQFDQIASQVWLNVSNRGKAGDLLWSPGMALTVASRRFAEALLECGAADLSLFPITIKGQSELDYLIVICEGQGRDRPVREFPLGRYATPWLDVSAEVAERLSRIAMTGVKREPATTLAQDFAAEAAEDDVVPNVDEGLWVIRESDSQLRLTIPQGVEDSMFSLPLADWMGVPAGQWMEQPTGSMSVVADDGTEMMTLEAPSAVDASGAPVNAFLFVDGGRILVNVDHLSVQNAYPISISITRTVRRA